MAILVGDFRKPVRPADLGPAGMSGALRYWAKQGGSTTVVGITEVEVAAYEAAKKPLGTIYEARAADWMSGGAAAGEQAGKWLLTQFKAASWTPTSLYLAADSNALSATAVDACLDGVAQILGWKPDLYGYLAQLQVASQGKHANRYWLTGHYVSPADYPWISLYQCQGSQPAGIPTNVTVSGVVGDVDIVFRSDWAQPGGDMPLTPVDIEDIWGYENPASGDTYDMHKALKNAEANSAAAVTALTALKMQVATLAGQVSTNEVALLAAIKAQTVGGDVNALAAALAPLLNQNDVANLMAAIKAQWAK